MRKRYVLLCLVCLMFGGCGKEQKEEVVEPTPSPTATYESVIDETKRFMENDTSNLEVYMGSDYAVASRSGKTLTFINETDGGYLVNNESAIEFVVSDESNCKVFITLEDKTVDEIVSEYELKYGEYTEVSEEEYRVLKSDSVTSYALKQVDNVVIKMEIQSYSDNCVTIVDSMLSIE